MPRFPTHLAGYPLIDLVHNTVDDTERASGRDIPLMGLDRLKRERDDVARALSAAYRMPRNTCVYTNVPPCFEYATTWLSDRLTALSSEIARKGGDPHDRPVRRSGR